MYSSNQETKRSPSSVIAPSKHAQSRCPERLTLGRVPRETTRFAARPVRISSSDRRRYGGVHLPPLVLAHRETPLAQLRRLQRLNDRLLIT